MDAETFKYWRGDLQITDTDILSATGATERTFRRWKAAGIDLKTERAILFYCGFIRFWTGWQINKKFELRDPAGDTYGRGEIMMREMHHTQARIDRRTIRDLKKEIEGLKQKAKRQTFLTIPANDQIARG